jgi:hypothetical protein
MKWLAQMVWDWALSFQTNKDFYGQEIKTLRRAQEILTTRENLRQMSDSLNLQWPTVPTLKMYRVLQDLWRTHPVVPSAPFPLLVVEEDDEDGNGVITGKVIYDPEFDLDSNRWILAALWIYENPT